MKKLLLVLGLLVFCAPAFASHEIENISAEEALAKLKAGNKRFVENKMQHPNVSIQRKREMEKGQKPYVATLSCSDSRLPVEVIFDQGLGDIFSIRNAGNIIDDYVLGSIEYAVYHLGVKLVVIMGHENCGAVGAAMSDSKEARYTESLKKAIKPCVKKCEKENCASYDNIIKENAKHGIELIAKKDKKLAEYMEKHNVKVIQAYYNLKTNVVEFSE